MADHAQYPIDVAELWGPDGETELTPVSSFAVAQDLRQVAVTHANGHDEPAPTIDRQMLADLARLADAIAANHSDVLRRSDLDGVRKELEDVFTQQLASTRQELMAGWNARFASAEAHIEDRVIASGEAQTKVLASSMEANFYAALEMAETVRSELRSFKSDLGGISALTEVLRRMQDELTELRHDVSELRAAVDARVPTAVTVQDV
jgi:BMFP domain-containing protein YqiC